MNNLTRNEYRPDVVSVPGETLQEALDERGMTQADLARRMDRPLKTVNEIVKGKAAVTPETALQLERVLGISAAFWNRRESLYREYLARSAEEERLRAEKGWLRELPLPAMIGQGWVRKAEDPADQAREVLNFFGMASPKAWGEWCSGLRAAYRGSPAFASNPAAVAAWLRRGEIEARAIACRPYDAGRLRDALPQLRSYTLLPLAEAVQEATRLCAACGIAVVLLPELPGTRLCGAARWLTPEKALVQLSLRHKTDDHLWFAFFHEVGHVLLHGKKERFLDTGPAEDGREEEADRFASDALVPLAGYRRFLARFPRPDAVSIRRFASEVGIAPGIVVGRLQHEGVIPWSAANELKERLCWREADGAASAA